MGSTPHSPLPRSFSERVIYQIIVTYHVKRDLTRIAKNIDPVSLCIFDDDDDDGDDDSDDDDDDDDEDDIDDDDGNVDDADEDDHSDCAG